MIELPDLLQGCDMKVTREFGNKLVALAEQYQKKNNLVIVSVLMDRDSEGNLQCRIIDRHQEVVKLGKSQMTVYRWLRKNGPATPAEIGEALYEKTSSCGKSAGVWPKEKTQVHWAREILRQLRKKNLVFRNVDGDVEVFAREDGPEVK